jgi:GT2 family glycosyltransferase
MNAAYELVAELMLDERAPERSGLRLLTWAKTCGVSALLIPWRSWMSPVVLGALQAEARAQGLSWYVELRPGMDAAQPVVQGARGYFVRDPAAWDVTVLDGLTPDKPLLLLVEPGREATVEPWATRWGAERVTAICLNPGERLQPWLHMRQRVRRWGCAVGYSDLFPAPWRALNGALAQAAIVLKGLTLNRSMGGPEHQESLYPDEFAALVDVLREHASQVHELLHDEPPAPEPVASRLTAARLAHEESLVAARPLKQGSALRADDLRPAPGLRGLRAELAAQLVGRRLLFDRQPDEPLTFGVVEPWDATPERQPLEISVVIRTKNEAAWLRRTLAALCNQRRRPREIIIVDNESIDDTIALAVRFGCRVVTISGREFTFGRALNRGIEASVCNRVVCLSAHAIPVHDRWLEAYDVHEEEAFTAAIYGRQEPLPDTNDFDKRDLWTTFGAEARLQRGQDYFFHNANSLIRKDVWARIPFDETLRGVEDRDWAKKVLADGHRILYAPLASVHHYHGIHQGRNEARARRVAQVIELIQRRETADSLS